MEEDYPLSIHVYTTRERRFGSSTPLSVFRVHRAFRDSDNKTCSTNFLICATKRKLNED